jgi:hypothetical protein
MARSSSTRDACVFGGHASCVRSTPPRKHISPCGVPHSHAWPAQDSSPFKAQEQNFNVLLASLEYRARQYKETLEERLGARN